jgi:hypothetical protein
MHAYVLIALFSAARLSRCKKTNILTLRHVNPRVGTTAARKPVTAVKEATASRSNNYSLTTTETVYQSFHIRHLFLPILTAAPTPSSSTYPHVGGLHCHQPPRHIFFTFQPRPPYYSSTTYPHGGSLHCPKRPPTSEPSCFNFPTTSGLFLRHSNLCSYDTNVPYLLAIFFSTTFRSSSGTPTYAVVTPTSAHRILLIKATTYNCSISISYLAHIRH